MPSTYRVKTAKTAWGELQEKANTGFARGYIAALSAAVSSGMIGEAEAKELLKLGVTLNPEEHPLTLTKMKEASE